MVTNDRPTKMRGRTLWDFLHENQWVMPFILFTSVMLLLRLIEG